MSVIPSALNGKVRTLKFDQHFAHASDARRDAPGPPPVQTRWAGDPTRPGSSRSWMTKASTLSL